MSWIDDTGARRLLIGSLNFVNEMGNALAAIAEEIGMRGGPFVYPMTFGAKDCWACFWDTIRWLKDRDRFKRSNVDELASALGQAGYEFPPIYELRARAA